MYSYCNRRKNKNKESSFCSMKTTPHKNKTSGEKIALVMDFVVIHINC